MEGAHTKLHISSLYNNLMKTLSFISKKALITDLTINFVGLHGQLSGLSTKDENVNKPRQKHLTYHWCNINPFWAYHSVNKRRDSGYFTATYIKQKSIITIILHRCYTTWKWRITLEYSGAWKFVKTHPKCR